MRESSGSFIGGQELTGGFRSQALQSDPLRLCRMLSREVARRGRTEASSSVMQADPA